MNLKGKKILVVVGHPDDEAISCGGLIMKAKAEKAKVFVMYMATGDSRQFMNGETKQDRRIEEVVDASKYGGFNYSIAFTNVSTKLDVSPQKDLIEAIEDRVKTFKPDIVVIPYTDSYNQDHRAVSTACITALRPIPQDLHHQPEMILEMEEPYSWPNAFNPNFYVDITDFMIEKMNLYKKHASQIPQNIKHSRSIVTLMMTASVRGTQIGVGEAEAYKLLKGQM